MGKKIVAITACPVGIAHTYMAATALETIAKEKGHTIKVEKQGSMGPEDVLTAKDIAEADLVIIAVNKNVDLERFKGKLLYQTTADHAMKNKEEVLELAFSNEAAFYGVKGEKVAGGAITLGKSNNAIMNHMMSGLSYMIPLVIVSGLMMALANVLSLQKDEMGNVVKVALDLTTAKGYFLSRLNEIGKVGFLLMIPMFAGFMANSIAGMPAIAPAMIGAFIANDGKYLGAETGGGFLSAILVGLMVGYFVNYLKMIKWPNFFKPILGIMILPILSTLFIMLVVTYGIGKPISLIMTSMYGGLDYIVATYPNSRFLIGSIIGGMIGFDFGGPVNKTAVMFGNAVFADTLAQNGFEGANFYINTVVTIAISVAPMGIWLSTKIFPNLFNSEEKVAANAAATMGVVGISEGAIPFAVNHPLQIISASVIGSASAGGISYAIGMKKIAGVSGPFGGIIGYVEAPIPILSWVFTCCTGYLVTALIIGFWRKLAKKQVESIK